MAFGNGGDLLGGADGDDFAAAVSAFGTHVDQPIGGLDDVQVVLDNQDGVAGGDQAVQDGDQLLDIGEVQAGSCWRTPDLWWVSWYNLKCGMRQPANRVIEGVESNE